MRFEWDEAKRLSNLRRHGFDFIDVERVFAGNAFTLLDDRFDYGEIRFITLGMVEERVVTITHTETDEVIRVISFRKASKNEEEIYDEEIRD
ncbi:MAG: BrnT family toxin [Acidobacteriota bacterium]